MLAGRPGWLTRAHTRAGGWVKGTAHCWMQERTDGRLGAGSLLDLLSGTERISADIGLLEVPALVSVFTKTGHARVYSGPCVISDSITLWGSSHRCPRRPSTIAGRIVLARRVLPRAAT